MKLTYIFDFDGTIADTFHQTIQISNKLSKEFTYDQIDYNTNIEQLKHLTSIEMIKHLNIPVFKLPAIIRRAKQELNNSINIIKPFQGLTETLLELKQQNCILGILSSNSKDNVQKFLKNHNMDFFDFIECSSRIWGKNISLRKLVQNQNITKENILYIGDETRDIEASNKAGIRSVAVTWGYNSYQTLKQQNPNFICHNPEEILNIR